MAVIYLDSCIVIYLIEGSDAYRQTCEQMFAAHADAETRFGLTELTRMECRVLPLRQGQQDVLELYEDFFHLPEINRLELNIAVFELATELRARHNVKTADALHLAAAIHYGCNEFWTNDLRLEAATIGRLHIVNPIPSPKE